MNDADLQALRLLPIQALADDEQAGLDDTLAQALSRAIADEQLHLVFQPQVCIASGEIVGAEALLRWQHPNLGQISPARFIPLAERTGQMLAIGDWVLRRACVLARKWQRQGLPAVRTMVNISAAQLVPGFAARIERLLQETGLEVRRFGVELTELSAMRDADVVAAELGRLRGAGVEIALDDFGTGASSLACLRRLPLDVVKIDRSLVPGLGGDGSALPIVRALIAMSRSLGLRTLAEGVTSEAQLEVLAASGCDRFQGFHFSAPVAARDFEAMLQAGHHLPVPERRRAARACRVLLVDDEPRAVQQLRQRLVASFGDALQVSACADARDAAHQLRGTRFDIVATALRMPGTDGISLLNMARQLQPDAVRLMLMGQDDLARVIDDPRQVDVFRYIAKRGTPEQTTTHFRAAMQQVNCQRAHGVLVGAAGPLDAAPDPAARALIELERSEPGITRVERGTFDEVVLPSQLLTMPGDLWAPARPPAARPARW
jgi:EAL domain-containing protein (putative c-di-GMP-specific phosphodiesterase class I)/DNA-binding NarL/FixJ family response regulator